MKCECPECLEYEGPNPLIMALKFAVLGLQLLVALVGMLKERSFKPLAVMLAAVAFFFTVPRYLICCRCEGYGTRCYPFYLGLMTSKYLPRVEGKALNPLAGSLEAGTLATVAITPLVGLRGNRKLSALYFMLANLTLGLHFWHACRHCAFYATDWRKSCPAALLAERVFTGGPGR